MSHPRIDAVDLRQLRALRAVARAGSFHGAASDLGYTQSAVSQQIKALERLVGHKLLDRTGARSPALPTAAGWALLRRSDVIFDELDQAAHDLSQLDEGLVGTVAIGYFESVGATLLPPVLRDVARSVPNVELRLSEAVCDGTLQSRVAHGELDMAFVVLPLRDDALHATTLLSDRPVALVRRDDPLSSAATIDPGALRDRRLATFGTSAHQVALEAGLQRAGAARIAFRTDENATLAGMVSSGSAVAVMTELSAQEAQRDGLVAVAIRGLRPRAVAIARHGSRQLSPAAATVLELIRSSSSASAARAGDVTREPSQLRRLDAGAC